VLSELSPVLLRGEMTRLKHQYARTFACVAVPVMISSVLGAGAGSVPACDDFRGSITSDPFQLHCEEPFVCSFSCDSAWITDELPSVNVSLSVVRVRGWVVQFPLVCLLLTATLGTFCGAI
jgi:hypothetical protein